MAESPRERATQQLWFPFKLGNRVIFSLVFGETLDTQQQWLPPASPRFSLQPPKTNQNPTPNTLLDLGHSDFAKT